MKRVFLLCMAILLILSGAVSAEIKKNADSFTNGIRISSLNQNSLENVEFCKNLYDEHASYDITISVCMIKELKSLLLADRPLEIKIDEYPIFEVKQDRYIVTDADDDISYISAVAVKLPLELADKIKDAKRVAIRYEDIGGRKGAPYILSDEVLSEWKQVINTTE